MTWAAAGYSLCLGGPVRQPRSGQGWGGDRKCTERGREGVREEGREGGALSLSPPPPPLSLSHAVTSSCWQCTGCCTRRLHVSVTWRCTLQGGPRHHVKTHTDQNREHKSAHTHTCALTAGIRCPEHKQLFVCGGDCLFFFFVAATPHLSTHTHTNTHQNPPPGRGFDLQEETTSRLTKNIKTHQETTELKFCSTSFSSCSLKSCKKPLLAG